MLETAHVALLAGFLLASGVASADCVPKEPSSTVFNASHDLHKITVKGVHYEDLNPNDPKLDATAGLNAAIGYVTGNSQCDQLVLDPGTYNFRVPAPRSKAYVSIENSSKSFDFRGASFIFKESYYPAFFINNCDKCTFGDVSIDYVNLPFTQLNVTHVTSDAIVVAPQDLSWPNPQQLYNHQSKFGKVTLYGFDTRAGIPQYGYTRWLLKPPLADAHRLPIDPYSVVQEGDVFIVAARGGGPAVRIQNSQASTFKDITIHTSAGPGVEVWWSKGISLIGTQIVPRIIPGASTIAPTSFLVSTVAGGIEFDAVAGAGNLVSNSVIHNAQDDSIAGNVTALNAVLYSATPNSITVCEGQTPPTSPVFMVNATTGNMIGSPWDGPQYTLATSGSNVYAVTPAFTPGETSNLLPGAVIYSGAQFSAASYMVVENNQIANSYLARGIAFSGMGRIRISDNTITNTQQAGIFVGTALPENGPVSGVLITGNNLVSTNMGMSGVGTGMLGAIEIMSFSLSGQAMSAQPSQKVFISKNKISETQRSGIWIANVDSGDVAQNTVSKYHLAGTNLGITPHLNFGIEPYAKDAFQAEVLGWCTRNVTGLTSPICNLQLQPPSPFRCLEPPGENRKARGAKPAR